MNHFSFELSLVAVIPALFLCGYVFYKDKAEKEPIGLLLVLFGLGALSYIPAYFLQEWSLGLMDSLFAHNITVSAEGALTFASQRVRLAHLALCAFFGFSLWGIGIKWCILFFATRRNKHFNYLFDGVVYSVFLSLGFAVSENILFFLQNDMDMLPAKLLTSVPCHLFIGVLMGYFYTMWHMRFAANGIEADLLQAGAVEKDNIRSSAGWLIGSLLVPFGVNGIYVLAGSVPNDTVMLFFYVAVFLIFSVSFAVIDRIASRDTGYGRYLHRIIAKAHPELSPEQISHAIRTEGVDET